MVENGAFSHRIDYVKILNLKGHPNCIAVSQVTAILLNWWILPIDRVAFGRVCACIWIYALLFYCITCIINYMYNIHCILCIYVGCSELVNTLSLTNNTEE